VRLEAPVQWAQREPRGPQEARAKRVAPEQQVQLEHQAVRQERARMLLPLFP